MTTAGMKYVAREVRADTSEELGREVTKLMNYYDRRRYVVTIVNYAVTDNMSSCLIIFEYLGSGSMQQQVTEKFYS